MAVLGMSSHGRWKWLLGLFSCVSWERKGGERLLVTVNYASHSSQCFVPFPMTDLANQSVRFKDQMSPAFYDRSGNELQSAGLFLDLPPWGYHVFDVKPFN